MKRISAFVLALGCTACANQPSNDAAVPDASLARSVQAGAPIGLARVSFQPGVAIIESSIEHVLYPGNEIKPPALPKPAKSRRVVERPTSVSAASALEHVAPVTERKMPLLDLRAAPASEEEMRRAWRKHCKDSPEMTSRDWEIVTTTMMPSDIAEYWDKHCAEGS